MRLRSFIVSDMAEAMSLVRREMGSDAIIVSSAKTPEGNLEVRAALDRPAPAEPQAEARDNPPARELGLVQALAARGVPAEWADSLGQAAESLEESAPETALALALETRFGFSPLSPEDEAVILIGLPGSGKTSACGKLAARAAVAKTPVRIICADWLRAGGAEQLAHYASVAKAGFAAAQSLEAMAGLVEADDGAPAIIDAPGHNLHAREDRDRLVDLIDACGAEPVLTIEATLSADEAFRLARRAAELGVRRFILTKLDVAYGRGAALGAALCGDLAFAQFSASPYLAGGFAAATPLRLARFLLESPAQGESGYDFTDGDSP